MISLCHIVGYCLLYGACRFIIGIRQQACSTQRIAVGVDKSHAHHPAPWPVCIHSYDGDARGGSVGSPPRIAADFATLARHRRQQPRYDGWGAQTSTDPVTELMGALSGTDGADRRGSTQTSESCPTRHHHLRRGAKRRVAGEDGTRDETCAAVLWGWCI